MPQVEMQIKESSQELVIIDVRGGLIATKIDLTTVSNEPMKKYFERENEGRTYTQAVLIGEKDKPRMAIVFGQDNLEIRGLDPEDRGIKVEPPFNQEGYVFTDEKGCFGCDISACLPLISSVAETGKIRESGTIIVAKQDEMLQVIPIPGPWAE